MQLGALSLAQRREELVLDLARERPQPAQRALPIRCELHEVAAPVARIATPLDEATGEQLDDVLMFRVPDLDVKELLLADERGVYFTTPHFDGYAAVLVRIPDLAHLERDELHDLVAEAWLTRAPKRVAKAWLQEQSL